MKPKNLGYPHEIWTQRLLAKYVRENCIKEKHPDLSKINQGTISKILNASNIKTHKIRIHWSLVKEFSYLQAIDFALKTGLKFLALRCFVWIYS